MTKEPARKIYSFTVDPEADPDVYRFLEKSTNRSETIRALLKGHLGGTLKDVKDLDVRYKEVKIAAEQLKIWKIGAELGLTQKQTEGLITGETTIPTPVLAPPEAQKIEFGPPVPLSAPVGFREALEALYDYIQQGGDVRKLGPECFTRLAGRPTPTLPKLEGAAA